MMLKRSVQWSGVRRLWVILILVGVFQVVAPRPALAIWGALLRLSGPGPFDAGFAYNFRLACFTTQPSYLEAAQLTQAAAAFAARAQLAPPVVPDAGAANTPTQQSAQTQSQFVANVLNLSELGWAASVKRENDGAKAREIGALIEGLLRPGVMPASLSALRPRLEEAKTKWDQAAMEKSFSFLPLPILISGCSGQSLGGGRNLGKPMATLDLGYQAFTTTNPEFAGGKEITLKIVQPRFSFRVWGPPFDFLDAGVGLGMYSFTSEGFDSFRGLIVEPLRFDVHAPSRWTVVQNDWSVSRKVAAGLLDAVHVHFGFVVFPDGFDGNPFKGTGAAARDIPGGEFVFLRGVTLTVNLAAWQK